MAIDRSTESTHGIEPRKITKPTKPVSRLASRIAPPPVLFANLTVAANGEKLGIHFLAAGKTQRAADNLSNENSGNDFFDFSESGRMRQENMVAFFDNIILPYINTLDPLPPNHVLQQRAPEKTIRFSLGGDVVHRFQRRCECALILDVYPSHKTDIVRQAAMVRGIELIFVPAGHTMSLQPLDIGLNAQMKLMRVSLVRQELQQNASKNFTKADAVINTQIAMDRIQPQSVAKQFAVALDNANRMKE